MRAVALISGGLDSILAAKVILGQGIDVVGLNCKSLFSCRSKFGLESLVSAIGIGTKTINVTAEILEIIKKPKHGFGSNLNPCIDCKIMMLKKAKALMDDLGASFIVTGEVLGQRPMSQQRYTMLMIEKEAGLKGLIVRPLSAKRLDETIPEQKKWVNRDRLFSITGRGRKDQINLAKELEIKEYNWPAGGCLLTDPNFVKRLEDLIDKKPIFDFNDLELLKLGRHLRLNDYTKLIVGRNEIENNKLVGLAKDDDYVLSTIDVSGPVGLLRADDKNKDYIELSAGIIASYSDLNQAKKISLNIKNYALNIEEKLTAIPLDPLEFKKNLL